MGLGFLLLAGGTRALEFQTSTWSLVCVDPRTREVAVAGASCVQDVSIIASTIKNVGAAATQALYSSTNKSRVEQRMLAGDAPQAIIDTVNMLDSTPQVRQYGVATLAGGVAHFTGTSTAAWSGAVSAPWVTVQGNILQGAAVVNDALAAFQNPNVPLVDRLVGGLQAGQVAGGDTRCTFGADSAFIRIMRADDIATFYCDLKVTSGPGGATSDPIAALAQQVASWKQARASQVDRWTSTVSAAPATIPPDGTTSALITITLRNPGGGALTGQAVTLAGQGVGTISPVVEQGAGVYTATVTSVSPGQDQFTAQSGGVSLGDRPTVVYGSGVPQSSGGGGGGCGLLGLELLLLALVLTNKTNRLIC